MLDSLQGAYRAQQRFVADASHELRAPLTAIQGNLELLERQTNMPPEERRQAVSEAKHEAHRLARLVADLLALARADAGVPLRREPVELDRILMESVADARHLTRGQKLEVGHLEPAVVHGDPDRLKQLILILLDNAIKYTPPSGQVTASLHRNGQSVEVAVRDTGIGIPKEALPRVFDRFYRADPARTRDPGGTGLGLSIARWIAEQHSGAVTIKSSPGQGTTATAHLPLNDKLPSLPGNGERST
jgi:signal transduction histidine kinase